jgi:hypothetical protein
LDRQRPETGNGFRANPSTGSLDGAAVGYSGGGDRGARGHNDSGGASRFFYVAKPDRAERNSGLGGRSTPAVSEHATMGDAERADWKARNGNFHPTVKPVDLMRYLCRLVSPPGMTILDPFMGSGTTGVAAIMEGFKFVGCEMNADYAEIAAHRIQAAPIPLDFDAPQQSAPTPKDAPALHDLFTEGIIR